MRDPQRIEEIIPLLQSAWALNPELRLGQLICALSVMYNGNSDPFYLEDDKLLLSIQKYFAEHLSKMPCETI